MSYEEREVSIGEIDALLQQGYEIEVDSCDGYVPIGAFVHKGMWDEYRLSLDDGRYVRCNKNHLFETVDGWESAETLVGVGVKSFICDSGLVKGSVVKLDNQIPIVDIQVDHPNHRYFTNGVSSHNTAVGKSLWMCHMAASTIMQGKNVLYVTMEMAEERIAERIDANLLNLSMEDLSAIDKNTFRSRIEKLQRKSHGHLIVKEYPEYGAHAGTIRALIEEIRIKQNIKFDMIIIDYLNICASSRLKADTNSYAYIKSIAAELRGLAKIFDVPVISATQTNRGGYDNSDVSLTDTSESFGLPATADLMFALISTEELEALGQLMVKQLKNRYGDPNKYKRFVVGVDRSKMKLYNLENSAQKNIANSGQPQPAVSGAAKQITGNFKF